MENQFCGGGPMKGIISVIFISLIVFIATTALAQPVKSGEEPRFKERFGIGIPAGLFNEDPVYGLDFPILLGMGFVLRPECPVIMNQYFARDRVLGYQRGRHWSMAVMPGMAIIWKTPIFMQCRIYIGVTANALYDITRKRGFFPATRFFGAGEVYIMRHWAFFIEMGGYGIFARKDLDYNKGVQIVAGQRLYVF